MWTYTPDADPVADKDKVRLAIGDVISTDQQLQDSEIVGLLTTYGSVRSASAEAARILAFKYARQADKWVGDLKILASQKSRMYLDLYKSLVGESGTVMPIWAVPTAGGVYVGDKESQAANDALVKPSFTRNAMDYRDGCE